MDTDERRVLELLSGVEARPGDTAEAIAQETTLGAQAVVTSLEALATGEADSPVRREDSPKGPVFSLTSAGRQLLLQLTAGKSSQGDDSEQA